MRTYNPEEVSILLGTSLLSGWNNIRIGRAEDGALFSVGTSGEVTRTINLNKLGSFVITMQQSSIDNETLSLLEISKTVIPCSCIDRSGTTVAVIDLGTVIKIPDSDLGKEAGTREWTVTGELSYAFIGSNNLDS
jgi:hypothetical protein